MNKAKNIYQFIDLPRVDPPKKMLEVRQHEFVEIYHPFSETQAQSQADRCLSCGNPYCQHACPLHNNIPDWLQLAYEGRLIEAAELAHRTNSLPEVCGRVCPQDRLCEGSCTLNSEFGAVTIGAMEKYITDTAFNAGWRPEVRTEKSGKKVAIIGAGPAGLGCADVLIRQGVEVTVFEQHSEIGGLLTFGIPAFKLEKSVMIRRRQVFEDMGIQFKLNTEIGKDISLADIEKQFDAIFMGVGTYHSMKADIPNEDAEGVYAALPFLSANTEKLMHLNENHFIDVQDKTVAVLGGGDTAMDCVRTALRQGAKKVTCVYRRDENNMPGSKKEVQNAKEEGAEFCFNAQPLSIRCNNQQQVNGLNIVRTQMGEADENGRRRAEVIANSEETLECDVILVAFGFAPHHITALQEMGIHTDKRGRIQTEGEYPQQTAHHKIFAGGDITRGSDLVVTAIAEGRTAARSILDMLNI